MLHCCYGLPRFCGTPRLPGKTNVSCFSDWHLKRIALVRRTKMPWVSDTHRNNSQNASSDNNQLYLPQFNGDAIAIGQGKSNTKCYKEWTCSDIDNRWRTNKNSGWSPFMSLWEPPVLYNSGQWCQHRTLRSTYSTAALNTYNNR
jgi:hypothetical protein